MPTPETRRRFIGLLGGLLAAAALSVLPAAAQARGCGSRGGPGGKRDKNGKCPSWGKKRK